MRKITINEDIMETAGSLDEFLNVFAGEAEADSGSFTAAVVDNSLNRLFPEEEKIRQLMVVSNITNYQAIKIIKALHAPYYMGLHAGNFGRESIYEKRVKIIEDFLRLRISINSRGRKDIVESLKAIMLNELSSDRSRVKKLLGKGE